MKRIILLAFFALALIILRCPVGAQTQYAKPNHKLTPGATNPALVADTSGHQHLVNGVEANLCAPDFRTGPWRKAVTRAELRKVCRAYGIEAGCPGSNFELDHLISLEIGGSDAPANLWPQPIKEARVKDHALEDKLPKLICAGKISLHDAQRCVAEDWTACAARIEQLEAAK